MPLNLNRPAPAFGSDVHHGDWGDRDVLAVLGPAVDGAVESSRARAEAMVGRTEEGVWPLLGVDEHEGRPAWLYPAHPGVSALGLIVRPPPMRVCLGLARAILARLRALEEVGLVHPGPLPSDVFVASDGEVHIAGFVGPSSADPTRIAPGEGTPEADLAYRFGAIACELMGATIPRPATDDDSQRTRQRRVAIRIMSRPGPVIDEQVRNGLVACLSFDPEARPTLDRLDEVLAYGASVLLQQPELATWAEAGVRECLSLSLASPRSTVELNLRDLRTEAGEDVDDPFVDDDVTAVSAGSTPGTFRRVELGSIPVTVGPPPEVARMRPTLPPDLFDDDPSADGETDEVEPAAPSNLPWFVLAAALIVLVFALAYYVWS